MSFVTLTWSAMDGIVAPGRRASFEPRSVQKVALEHVRVPIQQRRHLCEQGPTAELAEPRPTTPRPSAPSTSPSATSGWSPAAPTSATCSTDEHFARYRDDPFTPVHRARPGRRRRRRRDRGRGDRRGPRRRPAPQGRRRADPHRRPGGRHRGHLVLEPLPGRDVRRRVVHLHADARGARLHPHPALRVRRGDPAPPRGDRRPVRPRGRRPVPHRGDPRRVGRGRGPVADPHRPRRRGQLPLVRAGRRDPQPHEAARHPGHGGLRRALVPHGAVGLRVHRRRAARAPHRPGGQGRRPHRHRGDRHPVRAAAGRVGEARLRVPAHAVGHRRAGQPAHRSRLRRRARAGLAAGPHGQLPGDHAGPARRGRPGRRRVDAPLRRRPAPAAARRA